MAAKTNRTNVKNQENDSLIIGSTDVVALYLTLDIDKACVKSSLKVIISSVFTFDNEIRKPKKRGPINYMLQDVLAQIFMI